MTNAVEVTYVGHATVLIEVDGKKILTDPILRDRVMHLRRSNNNIRAEWYRDVDAVLISHMHYDHLDLPSLELLGADTRLIVPRGMAAMLYRRGYTQIDELTVDDTVNVGEVEIRATPADHDRARFRGGPTADTLGFVIEGSYTTYFPGDTDIFPEMANISDRMDVALLPVWGWGPTLGQGHLDPYRAALALQMLKPRLAIPIHWGTLYPVGFNWLKPGFLSDPPHSFVGHAKNLAPAVNVQILNPGESISVNHHIGNAASKQSSSQ
jgi:L-ascorbate metabolism protein UlaG (beta-lactamase superfamily)